MQEPKKRDWIIIGLLSFCLLLVAFNIALLQRSNSQEQLLAKWHKQRVERQNKMKKLGLEAIGHWQNELAAFPLLEKALICWKNDKYEESIDLLKKSQKINSKNSIIHYLLGMANIELKNDEQAIKNFSIYLDQAPSSVYAYWMRANIYFKQKKFKLAKEDLKKTIINEPDFINAKNLYEQVNKILEKRR